MSFLEQVNSIKEGVLKKPEYSIPIKSMLNNAQKAYEAEKSINENADREEEKSL